MARTSAQQFKLSLAGAKVRIEIPDQLALEANSRFPIERLQIITLRVTCTPAIVDRVWENAGRYAPYVSGSEPFILVIPAPLQFEFPIRTRSTITTTRALARLVEHAFYALGKNIVS